MTTLRKLHEELNITQRLSLYIKNQNKKYKLNEPLTADEELPKTLETLITINTLGKQRNHNAQAKYLHDMTGNYGVAMMKYKEKYGQLSKIISEKSALEVKLKEAQNKSERAEKIVNNANMRDYIIKMYRVALKFGKGYPYDEEMAEVGKKYTKEGFEYLSGHDLYKIVYKEVVKLEKFLAEKEGK